MQFSIIIPAKNELENLKRTLPQYQELKGSFLCEIIVADGASTDGTIEYARSMGARVEVKQKKERETIGEGRNRGAAVASGDILAFFDAGVRVDNLKSFFETVAKTFGDSRIVAAVPRVMIHPDEARLSDNIVHAAVNGVIRFWNFMGWGAGKGEAQIVRHAAFTTVGGYNNALVAGEDNDLYRRLARKGKIVVLSQLKVYDDPARYRKLGYPHVISQWIMNQIFVIFFGRSYSKEWKRVERQT